MSKGAGLGPVNWSLLLVVSAAAYAAYCMRWAQAPVANTDTFIYLGVVQDFLAHGHFSQSHTRTPGLPLFLLLVGTGRAYFYATLLLHLVSVSALALLLSRFAVRIQLIWAFVLVALLPPYVQNAAYLATESITAALLAFGFVGLSLYILDRRWPYGLLASLCFVWAGITRPTNLVTPFLLAAILLALPKRRLARAAALLVCVPALLLGSYILYSATHFQSFDIASMSGYQLSNSTVQLYEYIDNPIAREELVRARSEMFAEKRPPNFAVWRAQPVLDQRLGLSDAELGRFLLHMNLRLIVHHPEIYMEQIARTSNVYWFPYETKMIVNSRVLKVAWYGLQILVLATFLLELTVLAGLFVGSHILNREFEFAGNRAVVYLLAIAIVFQTMIVSYAVIGDGNARYRSVTDLLIVFAVALIADWGWTMWHASRRVLVLASSQSTWATEE